MVFKNFIKFLREFRVIAISVGFVVSLAVFAFIQSFVNDVVLPLLRPLISTSSTTWEEIIFHVGSANIRVGSFLSAFLSLFIILLLLYVIVTKILHWKPKK